MRHVYVQALLVGIITASAAGQFTSQNMVLHNNTPLNGFPSNPSSGNDCWGYTSASGREYALVGLRAALAVVEVTDPDNPVLLAEVSHTNSLWGDVKTYLDYAYVVNESGGGMDVIDLSDVDNGNVTLVRRDTDGGFDEAHNIVMNEDSGYVYVVGGNLAGGRLTVFDLNPDPSDPTFVGSVSSGVGAYVHDAQVVSFTTGPNAGKEIAFCANGGVGLDIYDVTDKSNMFRLSRSTYTNLSYCHQCWMSDDGTLLYVNDETDNINETIVFDVTDLSNPVVLNTYSTGLAAFDHNSYVHNDMIFEADYRSGVRVFDASSDPVDPTEIAWFDTFPPDDGGGFDGAWSVYPFFDSGTIVISDIDRGMFLVSLTLGGGGCCVGGATCTVETAADCATAGGTFFGTGTDCAIDTDDDGTPDCADNCPNDANKTEPGDCGCGVADDDSDGDGTPDCNDNCPNDENKTEPGDCGCGVAEDDSDGDGTPDCIDNCPNDENKTEPGDCGCGIADDDSDGDGTPNCIDNCPNDENKTEPGDCGCGVADDDSDGDGTADCNDNCSLPNTDQADCDDNGVGDTCEIDAGAADCDGNGVPDSCEGAVSDTVAPEITCPAAAGVACGESVDPAVNPSLGVATAVDACDPAPSVSFSDVQTPGGCPQEVIVTRTWTAADAAGNEGTCEQTITVTDSIAPTLDAPADISVPFADAGGCDAAVTVVPPTATDGCDASPLVSGVRSDGADLGDPYPATGFGGPVLITWTATDACGNESSVVQTITVDPFSMATVDVAFQAVVAPNLSRCLTFEFFDCPGGSVVMDSFVTFDAAGAASGVPLIVPCGEYTCVTVRDPLHTLRRTLVADDGFDVVGTEYELDLIGANKPLLGGNLNDDIVIDILDFGVMSGNFGAFVGASDCTTVGPHPDIGGNGFVDTPDFTFIQINFLQQREDNCCGLGGFVETGEHTPLVSVTVAELWANGLGHLTPADLDGDGVVDLTDVALFAEGVRPTHRVTFPRDEVERGRWHDHSMWIGATVPDERTEVLARHGLTVIDANAAASSLDIAAGAWVSLRGAGGLEVESVVVRQGGVLELTGARSHLSVWSLYVEAGGVVIWTGGTIRLADDGRLVVEDAGPSTGHGRLEQLRPGEERGFRE